MNPPPSPSPSIRVKRESSTFSSFSTSSRARTPTTGFLPSFSARDRVPFTPDLDASTPRLPDVSGRSDLANYSIAEQLKSVLDDDDHPAPPTSSPSDSSAPSHTTLPRFSGGISSRLLSEAFRREYSSTANEERKRAYSTMYTEEDEDRSARFSRAPSFAGSMASHSDFGGGGRKKSRSESQRPSQTLLLFGLGDGRQRNVNGKSLYGGQDLGVGVIGSQAFLNDDDGNSGEGTMEQQCDIPMPEEGCDWKVRQIVGEEEGMRFIVGPHIVSLEEDLPPLATEHPARVWNSILHSLPQELVPTVQWKYERLAGEDEDEDPMYLCQVTLSLSPQHPAIANHPSFSKLPVNRHTAEYITATAAIGGSRTWTGEPREVKSDATNSALVKCLTSGAFEWVHSSSLDISPTIIGNIGPIPSLQEQEQDEDMSNPTQTATFVETLLSERSDMPQPHGQFGSTALDLDGIDNAASVLQAGLLGGQPNVTPCDETMNTIEIKRAIQQFLVDCPSSIKPIFSLTVNWDVDTKKFIEKLNVGIESRNQSYQIVADPNSLYFGETGLRLAIAQGLEGFVQQIRNDHSKSKAGSLDKGVEGDNIISVPEMEAGDEEDMLVDWVAQLKAFCRSNNLRFPIYTQQVEKLNQGDEVKFRASMKLEEDNFRAESSSSTILQARQEIARWVYTQHFGQKPTVMEYSASDSGYRGGRGGRGGNRRGGGRKW